MIGTLRKAACAATVMLLALPALKAQAQVCDGVTDDTAAIQAAFTASATSAAEAVLPVGNCRITAPIVFTAPSTGMIQVQRGPVTLHYSQGPRLRGAGVLLTTIIADYDGDLSLGGVFKLDTATPRSYIVDFDISRLRILRAEGRSGLNGLNLTAAWFGKIERVWVHGLDGDGVKVPWRADLDPVLSDVYQDHNLLMAHNYMEGNGGWAFNLGAGQSPGIYELRQNLIRRNAKGGIRSTTGHCRIIANNLQDNGTHGLAGSGALLFDTQEGPSFVALVEHNEFDNNFNWHVALKRVRGAIFRQNRFLSGTYESATSFVRQSGTSFMRPYVHVSLGSGAANEAWSVLFEQNYHRSVTGPSTTTASVIAYTASSNAVARARLIRNDFGPMPADGVTQNSTGLTKFLNFPGDTVTLDP